MKQRLKPLMEQDVDGKNKEYTFEYIMELFKSIRKGKVDFSGVESDTITERSEEQEKIVNLLKCL